MITIEQLMKRAGITEMTSPTPLHQRQQLQGKILQHGQEPNEEEVDEYDYTDGTLGTDLELDELVMELEFGSDDNELEEDMTYNIDYVSYRHSGKKYHNITRSFKNDRHFDNWYKWMNKQGLKIIGVHDEK